MEELTIGNYISRLTLNEVWNEIKSHISATFWYVFRVGLIMLIFYLLKDSIISGGLSEANKFLIAIPWWIYLSFAFGFILWSGRGKRIAPRLPMVDFKLWLILTLANLASLAALSLLPEWISLPFFVLVNPVFYIERLVDMAKKKGYQYDE